MKEIQKVPFPVLFLCAAALVAATGSASAADSRTSAPTVVQEKAPMDKPRQLQIEAKPWKGDFDGMLERRIVRVLVPYTRSEEQGAGEAR